MDITKVVLPAGIGVAALCVLGAVALILSSRRSREQDKMTAQEREGLADEQRKTWRRRLAVASLGVSFVIIFCIAGIAAWLSFGAQKSYAFERNGGSWTAATGFALLLDAGALGLSLLRLFEALTARSSQATRVYLIAFVAASATMNFLHTPHAAHAAPSFGGQLLAVIPPLVYAVFLETLLKKVEQLVLGKYPRRKKRKDIERGYSLWLWVPIIGCPWKMWTVWRADLHSTVQYVRAPGSRKPLPPPLPDESAQLQVPVAPQTPAAIRPAAVPAPAAATGGPQAPAPTPIAAAPTSPPASPAPQPAPPAPRPVSGSKTDQLRTALAQQVRRGDLRVLSPVAQTSNAAAYQESMRLGQEAGLGKDKDNRQIGLLAPGAVRAALKKMLPELWEIADGAERQRAAAAQPAPVNPAPGPQPPADAAPAPENPPAAEVLAEASGDTHRSGEAVIEERADLLNAAEPTTEPAGSTKVREASFA